MAEPGAPISLQAQNFLAYIVLHLHVGKPYLIPKDTVEAECVNITSHGAGIDTEYLIPVLVSSGLIGLVKAKNSDASKLVFKKNSFDTFKSSFPELNVSYMVTKTWNKRTSHVIVRGKVKPVRMSAKGSVQLSDDTICLPPSTTPLAKMAIDIGMKIQQETLEMFSGLYKILQLEESFEASSANQQTCLVFHVITDIANTA